MDPLSIAASVVGLIATAAQISSVLQSLTSKARDAPKSLRNLKGDVDAIRLTLVQLDQYIKRKLQAKPSRTALILIEQVVVILSGCVITFSEMEAAVESFDSDFTMGLMDRMRWVSKSDTISEISTRVQNHKVSLILMITILQSQTQLEADDAVQQLCAKVDLVLSENKILHERMMNWAPEGPSQTLQSPIEPQNQDLPPEPQHDQPVSTVKRNELGFAFEEELENSWVYKRATQKGEGATLSLISSAGRSASWSMLSGVSLSEVSIISVIAIPVYEEDISNSSRYKFGELSQDLLDPDYLPEPPHFRKYQVKKSRFQSLRERFERPSKPLQEIPPPVQRVFGVPIAESIRYANVAISLIDEEGKSYIYGYVPIIVAKVGVFLKEKGTHLPHIFHQSGSAKAVFDLQTAFDFSDRYGKGLDWTGFTEYDAASCLLRYLKTLPQPVVPYDSFGEFCPLDDETYVRQCIPWLTQADISEEDQENISKIVVPVLQTAVKNMPPLNRQLLLYLLDILAVFASISDANFMNVGRLTAAFQPAILSPPPNEISQAKQDYANAICSIMIEFQDNFLIGNV